MSVNINASTTNGLVLTSDTSGELKLQANGADIATVDSSGITMASGKGLAGDASSLTNIPAANLTGSLPAGMGGKILQVVSTTKTSALTLTGTSMTAPAQVTGLTATITPTSTSSQILVILGANFGSTQDVFFGYNLYRGTTPIMRGDAAGSRPRLTGLAPYIASVDMQYGGIPIGVQYVDSPSTTSATTYSVRIGSNNGTVYCNRSGSDRDTSTYEGRSASTITLMEIGA